MLKELIKNNFKKSISTYDEYAFVQKKISKKLASLIKVKKVNSILEIGSYSGLLTKEIVKNVEFKNYSAVDIINSGFFTRRAVNG